jgi:hypothetical protein
MLDTTTGIVDTHKVFIEHLSDTTYYVKVYDGHDQTENYEFKGEFELIIMKMENLTMYP